MKKRRKPNRNAITVAVLGIGALAVAMIAKARAQAATASNAAAQAANAASNPLAPVGLPTFSNPIPQPVPGSYAPTSAEVASAGSFWNQLQPVSGPGEGYVNFPSGSQAAATLLPFGMDSAGTYYTEWAGQVFQLQGQDAQGNWPAIAVG